MQKNIEFSDNILTTETFEDLGNAIHDLEIGRLEFSEPIRKVIIKNKCKSKKKYYFKVRCLKTVKGRTYYSAYSTIKAVKVK